MTLLLRIIFKFYDEIIYMYVDRIMLLFMLVSLKISFSASHRLYRQQIDHSRVVLGQGGSLNVYVNNRYIIICCPSKRFNGSTGRT